MNTMFAVIATLVVAATQGNELTTTTTTPLLLSWGGRMDNVMTAEHDIIVGFVFGQDAGFSDVAFSTLAGAYEVKQQDMCSWPGVTSMMPDAIVEHKAVILGNTYKIVTVNELEEKIKAGEKGTFALRLAGTARDDFHVKIHDAVIADVWMKLKKNHGASKFMIWLGQEAQANDDGGDTRVKRRVLAPPNTSSPTTTPTTTPANYIRMVPELFTGLLLFVIMMLILIMFFCCCMTGIEAPTAWVKPGQELPRGKEFN